MKMKNEFSKKLRRQLFTPIPVPKLNERYWIDVNCDIIDSGPVDNRNVSLVYRFDRNKEFIELDLLCEDSSILKATPASLYLLTFYGYVPGEIVLLDWQAHPKKRYLYKVLKGEQIDENTRFINGLELRRSPRFNAFVSKNGGCVMVGSNIVTHQIGKKGHHTVVCRCPDRHNVGVHRVVYDAWIGIRDPENDIHHIDVHGWNNDLENLEELTHEEHILKHKEVGSGTRGYSNEVVEEVCRLMQEGVRPAEAARRAGMSAATASRYRKGLRKDISSKYDYPELERYKRNKLTPEQVDHICQLFVDGELSNRKIGEIYECSPETIRDIREGRTWREISSRYEFAPNNPVNYHRKNTAHNAAKITEDMVIRIYGMLHAGIPPKKVAEITGVSYFTVKKIRYKIRWVELTDRLDAQYAKGEEGSTTIERVSMGKSHRE